MEPVSIRDINDSLKAEWARSRARQMRWLEEEQLIQEEMRRVIAYLDWRASWWITQGERRSGSVTPELQDGLQAYAAKQANILRGIRQRFACMWHPRLQAFHLTADWFKDASLVLPSVGAIAPPPPSFTAIEPDGSLNNVD
ncbi:hypothetical protein BDN71DRAFT_1501176 [Pleurotus eryngii]|uniref:Uncharacterized protein n=1 Tax=Pleurotus eryngii TaxID=5323 RepID=A0A9P6DK61_PLEER|nr:hypothetical protein BDN71DRAFT_1501176 [Pleurotus eryngii]